MLIILLLIFISACNEEPASYVNGDSELSGEIRYLKDTRTGLCFAETGYENTYSFTCVPCDSLKNVGLTYNKIKIK